MERKGVPCCYLFGQNSDISISERCAALFGRQSNCGSALFEAFKVHVYQTKLLALIRFRGESNTVAQELTHPRAVAITFAHVSSTSM